jgi:parvulin-like peptidyl-prolyl isomerase
MASIVRSLACTLIACNLAGGMPGAIAADGAAAAPAKPGAAAPEAAFATVGDTVITLAEYQRALTAAVRNKYYHAKPPDAELAALQREVGEDVVNRVLLLSEAKRRGLKPQADKIQTKVAGYDAQYSKSAKWQANRDKMLASVVPQLERESLLDQLEQQVRQVGEPAEAAARAYYDQHKDLFVEPEQVKLSLILLKVDPSSNATVWRGALEEGQRLHTKLQAGADFGELARLHSGDRSAGSSGQMEYVHRGMLPEPVQTVVDPLALGATSAPVRLLEGVAIIRLDGRKPARQRPFDEVKARAVQLWQRAEGDTRWKQLIAQLRRATPARIDEKHYAPLRSSRGTTPTAG